MRLASVRPRFRWVVDAGLEACLERLEAGGPGVEVDSAGRHASVTVDRSRRRRWSPMIQMELEEDEARTVVLGVVGPLPAVWTLYAFIASNIAIVGGLAVVVGLTQLMLGVLPWGLWGVPVTVVMLAGVYLASQVGRSLADEQTDELRGFLRRALDPIEEEG